MADRRGAHAGKLRRGKDRWDAASAHDCKRNNGGVSALETDFRSRQNALLSARPRCYTRMMDGSQLLHAPQSTGLTPVDTIFTRISPGPGTAT